MRLLYWRQPIVIAVSIFVRDGERIRRADDGLIDVISSRQKPSSGWRTSYLSGAVRRARVPASPRVVMRRRDSIHFVINPAMALAAERRGSGNS